MSIIPEIVIYSKAGCCLCVKAKTILKKVQEEIPFSLTEVDISQDQTLMEKYQYVIPVVSINGKDVLISKVSEFRFRRALQVSPKSFQGGTSGGTENSLSP